MKAIKVPAAIFLLLSLASLSARAQCPYAAAAAAAAAANSSGSSSQPGQFRTIVVSGSDGSFVPSTFQGFDHALALGSAAAGTSHSTFMTYDQAVKRGADDIAAKSRSVADAARQYQKKTQPQANTPATPQHKKTEKKTESAQDVVNRILPQ